MADETTTTQDNTESSSDETLKTEKTVPYDRFAQVNSDLQLLRKQLAEREKTEREKETASLAEQNRYKELYEQLKAEIEPLRGASEDAKRYRERLEADNLARISRIPEDKRSLIPEYDDPVKVGSWLTANEALIVSTPKPTAPSADGGARGNGQGSPVLSENLEGLARIAREMGYNIDSERVASYAKKPTKLSNEGDK